MCWVSNVTHMLTILGCPCSTVKYFVRMGSDLTCACFVLHLSSRPCLLVAGSKVGRS